VSQFESQFEEDLYRARRETLRKIAAIGARSGLSEAEATYPNHFRFTTDVPTIRQQFAALSGEQLEAEKPHVAIAGRVVQRRLQGKAAFAQLQQGGQRLQLYVRKDNVGDDAFELYKLLDLGDHIGVEGTLFRTRTNELTVQVAKLTFLAKAMLPLPDKFSGLGDIELRYRRRYLDLFIDTGDKPEAAPPVTTQPAALTAENGASDGVEEVPHSVPSLPQGLKPHGSQDTCGTTEVVPLTRLPVSALSSGPKSGPTEPQLTRLPAREVFVKRAAILRAIRKFFDERGYLEVETPMLHTIAGGAAARPFTTHHNALDIPLSLRIAPELYLKRLVVGGFDRVYEINRNFRNEGVSTQHNPEFTMLEFYQAYSNYHDLMDLTQELITFVANEVNGTTITNFNGTEIDVSKWTKLSMLEAIIKWWPGYYGPTPTFADFSSASSFATLCERTISSIDETEDQLRASGQQAWYVQESYNRLTTKALFADLARQTSESGTPGKSIATLFEYVAEDKLIQPHIIYDFPLAVSPLSKIKPDEPEWVERFEFYIGGFEVGNAFSELNDPEDQRSRFLDQLKERDRGDDEAHAMDEDYVRALGYGLPPTAGEGIGIDRLTMILTGSKSIRDVILFPLMRPHKTTPDEPYTHDESAE
jgi:lysyl-tRNA synthetase class 2